MNSLTGNLQQDCERLKGILSAQDILTFPFESADGLAFTLVFADAVTDKELLGEQVIRPLLRYRGRGEERAIAQSITAAEVRAQDSLQELADEVLSGNPVLLWEGGRKALCVGVKKIFVRAIAEPPTDIAVRGPREGFIEDLKINTSLVRRRLKSRNLQFEQITVGKQSQTAVAICYLKGTSVEKTVQKIKRKLQKIDVDILPDSSFLTHFFCSSKPNPAYSITIT